MIIKLLSTIFKLEKSNAEYKSYVVQNLFEINAKVEKKQPEIIEMM